MGQNTHWAKVNDTPRNKGAMAGDVILKKIQEWLKTEKRKEKGNLPLPREKIKIYRYQEKKLIYRYQEKRRKDSL